MPKLPSISSCRNLFRYDPDTGFIFWNFNTQKSASWNGKYAGKRAFTCKDKDGYLVSRFPNPDTGKVETHRAHRIAILLHTGMPPPAFVDHKNGDKSDNRYENIRPATQAQNNMNTGTRKGRSSQFVGIHKVGDRWRAMVQINGKQKHIGIFCSEEEAARARDEVVSREYGEFARLNFPL